MSFIKLFVWSVIAFCHVGLSTFIPASPGAVVIKNQYIVVLKSNPNLDQSLINTFANSFNENEKDDSLLTLLHTYSITSQESSKEGPGTQTNQEDDSSFFSFQAFSAIISPSIISQLEEDPAIQYITPDTIASIHGIQINPPNWGLVRLSQRNLNLSTAQYSFNDHAGSDVDVFVVDTGVYIGHSDFNGRASLGINLVKNGEGDTDLNGHGSHVAGIIGGSKYGVAKKTNIIAVKVLDQSGNGAWSTILAGFDWVAKNHSTTKRKGVVNLSVSSALMKPATDAISALISNGIHVVGAAGNTGVDSCTTSPGAASSVGAITVASINWQDKMSSFSGWGKCVDLFAAGEQIQSVGIRSYVDSAVMSGTSMSSPQVAGLIALTLSATANYTPNKIKQYLLSSATSNLVILDPTTKPGTPNKIAFSCQQDMKTYLSCNLLKSNSDNNNHQNDDDNDNTYHPIRWLGRAGSIATQVVFGYDPELVTSTSIPTITDICENCPSLDTLE